MSPLGGRLEERRGKDKETPDRLFVEQTPETTEDEYTMESTGTD